MRRESPGLASWVIGVAVALILALGAFFLITYDGRRDIDIEALLLDREVWGDALPNARPAINELCESRYPCRQAVISDAATVLRFDSRRDAVVATESWGVDGYRSCWIAVKFEPGVLAESERKEFMRVFDESNVASADGIPFAEIVQRC